MQTLSRCTLGDIEQMTDLEKLEYIHCTFQEIQNGNVDDWMVNQALSFVEDIREPHLQGQNNESS